MYGWIWRKLPFGWPGKLAGSLLLIGGVAALLWYVVFPKAEPLLPFDDSQISDQEGGDPTPPPGDESGQPEDTGENPGEDDGGGGGGLGLWTG